MTGAGERFLRSDWQGSIVTVASASDMLAVNRYDEYGIPQTGNGGWELQLARGGDGGLVYFSAAVAESVSVFSASVPTP